MAYILPKTYLNYNHIQYSETASTSPNNVILQSLSAQLYGSKEKITRVESDWDIYKKYTNPFEYIHTNIPFKKKSVSKYKPLSRSYFKLIELIKAFQIRYDSPIRSFHLAEGPGGFIEALAKLRGCPEDTYIGMTLVNETKEDSSIPGWKKSDGFLKENPNVILENGADNTGNILSIINFQHIISRYAKMDFITADGGFDFSSDFNNQELCIGKLLFAQVAYAVSLQKSGGTFILKIFDCFMQHTIDILYILSSFYEKVYIIKPNTSRYANSERYVVCIGFIHRKTDTFYPYFLKCFKDMLRDESTYPLRFFNLPISLFFIKKIEEYNSMLGKKQLQNIQYTLSFIENKPKMDKILQIIRDNIEKCIDWCNKYGVPYHAINNYSNIFLQKDAL